MSSTKAVVLFVSLFLAGLPVFPQTAEPAKPEPINDETAQTVPLTVATGVPLRVYLTQRLTKRLGETVHARLLEPVFAFDREVIPANTEVLGQVVKVDRVSKMRRAATIAGGDFTPLHDAEVEYTTLILPDGRRISMHTVQTLGLSSIYNPRTASRKKQAGTATAGSKPGVVATAKQQVKDRIDSVTDVVRGPDKMERLEDFLVAKLPYHPQWIRKGTRFDAELLGPLQFGSAMIPAGNLGLLGSQPPPDSIVHVRLITPVNSNDAEVGDKMEAIVSQPLFSSDRKLILPEGTRLTGAVTIAHAARWFRRGGQLRFSFRELELPAGLPPGLTRASDPLHPRPMTTLATLNAVVPANKTPLKVDDEGGVTAPAPKTRFIAPALAALIASRSIDDDGRRAKLEGTGTGNTGGRTLGGASGFGVLGMIAAQTSPTFAGIMGFYGMGWSVFNNIVARGSEVEFGKNAAMDIRFGTRTPAPGTKFKHADARSAGGEL